MDEKLMNRNEVIVIGAGANGLAVAWQLQQLGIPARIIDKAERVGEAWHHRHPQLRLNTHSSLSRLPGMAHAPGGPAFPARTDVIRYLEAYARQLRVPIDHGVRVERIRPSAGNWLVETDKRDYSCRHVVVATGLDRLPWMPAWPGSDGFRGELIHAAHFGKACAYRDKKVLVAGAGNSGSDILNHLATAGTAQTWVSVRQGSVIFPRYLYAIPVQRLSPLMARLPVALVDKMLSLTERLAFGNLAKWGMPPARSDGATRLVTEGVAPAIDDGFVAAIKSGQIRVVPEIRRFLATAVELADGERIEPDAVIAATGYRSGLDTIIDLPGLLDKRGVPVINGRQQHAAYPGLWFIGMRPRLPGFFYMACRDSRDIAKTIAAGDRQDITPGIADLARTPDNSMQG